MPAKKILLLMLGLALVGAAIGVVLWNKPHENIARSKADATIEAATLFNEYNTDETSANAKYLGKTIAVTGKVKESSKPEGVPAKVVLETGDAFSVVCELDALSQHARTDFSVGETITLKGKCDGFIGDVQITRCLETK